MLALGPQRWLPDADLAGLCSQVGGFLIHKNDYNLTLRTCEQLGALAFCPALVAAGARVEAAGGGNPVAQLLRRMLEIGTTVSHVGLLSVRPFVASLGARQCLGAAYVDLLVDVCLFREAEPSEAARCCRMLALCFLSACGEAGAPELPTAVVTGVLARLDANLRGISAPGRPKTPMPQTFPHKLQLRGWNAVCVLAPFVAAATYEEISEILYRHLAWPHLPDVRDFQETVACYWGARYLDFTVERRLVPALEDFTLTAQASASLVLVCSYLLRKGDTQKERLFNALVPYCSSNTAYVRGICQYALAECVPTLPASVRDSPLCAGLLKLILTNKDCVKLRRRQIPIYDQWDPEATCQLRALSLGVEKGEFVPSTVAMLALRDQIALHMRDQWHYAKDDAMYMHLQEAGLAARSAAPAEAPAPAAPSSDNFQRKYTPLTMGELFPALAERRSHERREGELIVVASLVDRTPNLAGLCRTAEIFGASKLVLPNLTISRDPSFQSISVTAEKWLPLEDCAPADLAGYLRARKAEGFTVVGVEQTSSSRPLQAFAFPRRCVLVLGAEKEGMPAALLPLLDRCVEIPQMGIIRSLNVHVSGAICMWEYARQHLAEAAEAP